MESSDEEEAMTRHTICLPHHGTQSVLQHGDAGFDEEIGRLYLTAENNTLETLIKLKNSLRDLPTDDFWAAAVEGMSTLLGAEMCFIMKRMLVDDHESAVEMPPIGEPGACMMAAALHYCANDGTKNTMRSTKFHAYGCPCAYMRHDKVFVIPERLNGFITNNPNQLPTPAEAYIAVPIFERGKCLGHFGAMWSVEGAARRKLSWAFIEMTLHALEDQITERFLAGANFLSASQPAPDRSRIIPHDAVTMAQSLRPYAGSLSHELRTPMHGIVGMLDVMYATVQEAVEGQVDPLMRKIFMTLKENIETVQDSSKRAIEAADNVVHAYDMDMSIPDAPAQLIDDQSDANSQIAQLVDTRPEILVAGSNIPFVRSSKRRHDDAFSHGQSATPTNKSPRLMQEPLSSFPPYRAAGIREFIRSRNHSAESQANELAGSTLTGSPRDDEVEYHGPLTTDPARTAATGLRPVSLYETIRTVIEEGLKVGGRPDATYTRATELGEHIEVRSRKSDGRVASKSIEWSVDSSVPNPLFVDDKDLSKLISCVFLNAVKFTNDADGHIDVHAKMSHRNRYVSITISDNGPGMPHDFLPKLFKAFSQENSSITRSSDGLGLGLMVAKGIARKLGGDLMCTRTETEGRTHGTEFEIKIPLHAGDVISRPASPFGSPLPRRLTVSSADMPHMAPIPSAPGSPRRWAQTLHDAFHEPGHPGGLHYHLHPPSTPPSPKTLCAVAQSTSNPTSVPTGRPLSPSPIPDTATRASAPASVHEIDRGLAQKYPLSFLVAEDNKINRKLLISMLRKFGYTKIHEAHDGAEAVRQMALLRSAHERVDVVLMDLWMPTMDGYEATERILSMSSPEGAPSDGAAGVGRLQPPLPTVLAVTADVTDGALERAAKAGMKGFMTKPYKLIDLQKLITEYCTSCTGEARDATVAAPLNSVFVGA